MKTLLRGTALLLVFAHLCGCGAVAVRPNELPPDVRLRKGLALPVQAGIGIYLPAGAVQYGEYYRNQLLQRGRYMRAAVDVTTRHFFKTVVHRDQPTPDPIRLMLDLDPKWSSEAGKLTAEFSYRLYDATGKLLKSGVKSESSAVSPDSPNVTLSNLVIRAMQKVLVEIVNSPQSATTAASPTTTVAEFPAAALINEASPYRLGTGFYINKSGQVVTAASLVQQCLRVNVGLGEARRTATLTAQSALLNLAVLDTGAGTVDALSVAPSKAMLGATTTSASFLRGKEDSQPPSRVLSFGNLVGLDGAAGAFGVVQFSTASQPATFGSAILGPDGRLTGVYTGAYSYDWLHKQGRLPANTYQAVDGGIAAQFFTRNNVPFTTDAYTDDRPAVDRATAATVAVACYQ